MLTQHQRAALLYLQSAQRAGFCPSYRNMAYDLDLTSVSLAYRVVSALVERGYAKRSPRRRYGLTVIKEVPRVHRAFRFNDETKELEDIGLFRSDT